MSGFTSAARIAISWFVMLAAATALGQIATPTPTVLPSCGNGGVDANEECDDGRRDDGDGCSATCQLESPDARCVGMPSSSTTDFDAQRIADGLGGGPVFITAPPLDPSRVFIVERIGVIDLVRTNVRSVFMDINVRVTNNGGEQGLLSMAFHPDYERNGRFFINYINNDGDSVIARYQIGSSPNFGDPTSELILLTIDRPGVNHNGGQLAFGPDGYLYFGMGDSGGGGDPGEVAQSMQSLLGKILRLDVDVDEPPYYAIPPSNPNSSAGDPLGLIWAFGLRNPWRFSFDRETGDLYIGDVGQGQREEIDFQPASNTALLNYGWDIFEGNFCFEPAPARECPNPPTGFTFPIFEYDHSVGCSISGGYVYRGCALPALHGRYFFSDFCVPFIRSLRVVDGAATDVQDHTSDLDPPGTTSINAISSYGEDARGELYIADLSGQVFKIVPHSSPTPTITPSPTRTPTMPTFTPSMTPTRSDTPTRTPTDTHTFTPLPTNTRTRTFTRSMTPTRTLTFTPSATSTRSETPSRTPTVTATATDTVSPTVTPSFTLTPSPTTTPPSSRTPSPSTTATPSQTATASASPSASATESAATVTPTQTPITPRPTGTATPPYCYGDCDGRGGVTVDELLLGIRIVLGQSEPNECPGYGGVTTVTVQLLVRAVNNALAGCP